MMEDDDVELISSASGVWWSCILALQSLIIRTMLVLQVISPSLRCMEWKVYILWMCITLNISEGKNIHLAFS